MLQQFLRTASDGWDLALASARNLFAEADLHADEVGGDFAGEAHRLGVAVSEVHEVLREHFGTEPLRRRGHRRRRCATGWPRPRPSYPSSPAHADALERVFAAHRRRRAASAQRVHGDLHLGQTLRTSLGWKLVDFEGEPAKPLAERRLPDSPWRDVAGMLRSFDYAAQSVVKDLDSGRRARPADRLPRRRVDCSATATAFLEGYVEQRGEPVAAADPDRAGPHRRLRGRQGRLRGRLRGPQPAHLAGHPAAAPSTGSELTADDASPTIGELDLHLINEGRHERLWEALGAHVVAGGTAFRVWAPDAREVQVRGDFNGWDGSRNPLTQVGGVRRLGGLRPRRRLGRALQVPRPRRRRRVARQGRPDGLPHRGPAGHRLARLREHARVDRRRVDGRARRRGPRPTSSRCRSTRCTSARGASTPAAGPYSYDDLAEHLDGVRRRDGLHPRRAAARDGAPVRRLVGLPGHVVLRADLALRRPRRLPPAGRRRCTTPASA